MRNSKQWTELDETGFTTCKSFDQAHKLAIEYQDYYQVATEVYNKDGTWHVSVS